MGNYWLSLNEGTTASVTTSLALHFPNIVPLLLSLNRLLFICPKRNIFWLVLLSFR